MIDEMIARLEAAGHQVVWGYDGSVTHSSPGDRGWWATVDGEELVAFRRPFEGQPQYPS